MSQKVFVVIKGPRRLWLAFLRSVIVLLAVFIAAAVYITQNPAVLRRLLLQFPGIGLVEMPAMGPTALAPNIAAPKGQPPSGQLALWGYTKAASFGCGFLLRMEDGRRLAVSSAHSTFPQGVNSGGYLTGPDGASVVDLVGQLGIGHVFVRDQFSTDYVFWSLKNTPPQEDFLTPDARGAPQVGERVWLYNIASGPNGAGRRAGVVMIVKPEAIWVRFDESFDPHGSSGCPVVSQHTGQLIGMVVAGEDVPPVVVGLNPVGSLLERAKAALPAP